MIHLNDRFCAPVGMQPSREVMEDLARLYPHVLILWHPIYERWQAYEVPPSSMWTAQRLRNAILEYHSSADRELVITKRTEWWLWRGAPRKIDDLPLPPGPWLLKWLAERDLHRVGASDFIRQYEEREERRRAARQRELHDMHDAVAHDSYRHVRDAIRGDPLAGHRKWTAPVGIDLKGGPVNGQDQRTPNE